MGTGLDKDVLSLTVYNNELYAGGRFDSAGAFNFTNHIAKWNGNNWVSLGAGITGGDVMAMCVYNGELYVGGDFTTAGGFAVPGIARWNGTTWNPVVSNLVGSFVGAIAVYNGELYVGGSFTSIGPINANNIARWDGINWSILGSGTDGVSGYVANLIVYNNELYASGLITEAGGIPVNNIAKWSNPTGINDFDIDFSLSAYPNPFRNEILVRGTNQNGELEIFDLTGKKIFTQCTVEKETNIMTSFLTPGFYLLKYSEPEKSVNLKLMKL